MCDIHAESGCLRLFDVVGGEGDGMANVYFEIGYAVLVPVNNAGIEREPSGGVGDVQTHVLAVQTHAESLVHCGDHRAVLALDAEHIENRERRLYGVVAEFGSGGVSVQTYRM